MELKQYLTPLLRYWWLLIAACLVSAISSFLITSRQPPIYQTSTTLVVGRAVYQSNPRSDDLWLNQMLASYYADLAQRQPVQDATMAALGLEWLPSYVVHPLPNSQFIEIIVTDSSPVRAQAVANQLANQIMLQSPTAPQNQEQDHQTFIDQQLYDLEARITETQGRITDLEDQLTGMNSARQIAETQAEITTLNSLLITLQTNYASLMQNTEAGAVNTLSIVESAPLPESPIGPNRTMIVLLSTIISLLFAAGAAYLLEFLDNTVKTVEDIAQIVQIPSLGEINRIDGEDYPDKLIALKRPLSPIVESYRVLRMNIQFSSLDKPLKSIMITSPQPKDGKSIILSNLAVVMAQAGLRVILIDTDMRRPSIHKIFGLQNISGLSNAVLLPFPRYKEYLQETSVKNLRVLTSGPLPPSPGELIGSVRFGEMIECMKGEADILLFDSPPCLLVADAAILGTRVDGVILVNSAGKTRKKDTQKAVEELSKVRVNLLGVVLNHQTGKSRDYYQSQYYYQSDKNPEKHEGGISLPAIPFSSSKKSADGQKGETIPSEKA